MHNIDKKDITMVKVIRLSNILFSKGGDSMARAMDSSVVDGKALCRGIKSSSLLASDIVTIPSSGTKVI